MNMVILRGVSGAGKSTRARELASRNMDTMICSADDYFTVGKHYLFNSANIGKAHAWCLGRAVAALELEVALVIIDNTNTQEWEMRPYIDAATYWNYEYEIEMIGQLSDTALQTYAARNIHNVPLDTIRRQAARFKV